MKHILFTNNTLDNLGGSELYIYDLAREYQRRGHKVTCFTLKPGRISERLARCGIQTLSDLSSLNGVDIIHSHHRLEFKIAAAYFPHVPLVHGSLGPTHPIERPNGGANIITRHIAISRMIKQVLAREENIPEEKIDVVPNFVDLTRFSPANRINERPRRVLLMSNYFQDAETLRQACELAGGLELNWIGEKSTPVWEVEKYIEQADIVVTLGQGALQAMAMGRAVIVAGTVSSDGIVTPANFEDMTAVNFNGHLRKFFGTGHSRPMSAEELAGEIKKYDRESAEALMDRVREEFNVSRVADNLLAIYDRAADQFNDEWADRPSARLEGVSRDLGAYLAILKDADTTLESLPWFYMTFDHLKKEWQVRKKNQFEFTGPESAYEELNYVFEKLRNLYEQNKTNREQKAYLDLRKEYERVVTEFTRLEEHSRYLTNQVEQLNSGRVMKTLNWLDRGLKKVKLHR
jgi:glycosyltransferase involved in cell wall biosynthesis